MDWSNWTFWLAMGLGAAIASVVYGLLLIFARKRSQLDRESRIELSPDSVPDPFVEVSKQERRSSFRRTGNSVAILVSDEDAEVEPLEGFVLDRSMSGLGIEIYEEGDLEPGTILSIRPRDKSSTHWDQVEVVYSIKTGNSWRVGCQFARTPDGHTRLLYG